MPLHSSTLYLFKCALVTIHPLAHLTPTAPIWKLTGLDKVG